MKIEQGIICPICSNVHNCLVIEEGENPSLSDVERLAISQGAKCLAEIWGEGVDYFMVKGKGNDGTLQRLTKEELATFLDSREARAAI